MTTPNYPPAGPFGIPNDSDPTQVFPAGGVPGTNGAMDGQAPAGHAGVPAYGQGAMPGQVGGAPYGVPPHGQGAVPPYGGYGSAPYTGELPAGFSPGGPVTPPPKKLTQNVWFWVAIGVIGVGLLLVLSVLVGFLGGGEKETAKPEVMPAPSISQTPIEATTPAMEESTPASTESAQTSENTGAATGDRAKALEKAQSYADDLHMSKMAIYGLLTSEYATERFSPEDAQYAVDNVKADYKKNALLSAETYSEHSHMSKAGIAAQLIHEHGGAFTQEEADYAMSNLKADFKANALATAESYSKNSFMSKKRIFTQLTATNGEQFTEEEAQYAIDNLKADYKANALESARQMMKIREMSPEELKEALTSTYGAQFTEEEAQYALDNLK